MGLRARWSGPGVALITAICSTGASGALTGWRADVTHAQVVAASCDRDRASSRDARAVGDGFLVEGEIADTTLASLAMAERTFMEDVSRRRLDGWVNGFGDSAATFPPGGPITLGREVIRTRMERIFADTSTHAVWHPVYVAVACSGEMGYTYGYYRWTSRDERGMAAQPQTGKYVTVWRREPTRGWRVVVDLGNAGPAPEHFFSADVTR